MSAFRLTRPEPREAAVLEAVLTCLRLHPSVAWHARMNSGAGRIVRGKPGEQSVSQFMRWGFPGCPDVLGQLKDGRLLAVECKRPSGAVRAEQEVFLSKVARFGGVAVLARSVDDVARALVTRCSTEAL